jgi:hypothetical protein
MGKRVLRKKRRLSTLMLSWEFILVVVALSDHIISSRPITPINLLVLKGLKPLDMIELNFLSPHSLVLFLSLPTLIVIVELHAHVACLEIPLLVNMHYSLLL